MVTAVTSFGRSGLSDWLLQRVTGIVLLTWFGCVGATIAGGVDYLEWRAMFDSTAMKIFTLLAILSLAAHAWIGMWTIGSDYLRGHLIGDGANSLRFFYQVACLLITIVYLVWGIKILWGN